MTPSLLSEGACLDNNHSHFILVDDGTVGKYGGEIPFRASLQNCITTKKIAKSECVFEMSCISFSRDIVYTGESH